MARRRSVASLFGRGKKPAAVIVLLMIVALVRLYQDFLDESKTAPEALPEGIYMVERVVDGDTLLLANGARVRLQGVDTPETVKPNWPVEPFGPEASAFTKQAIEQSGGEVYLRFDKERKDRYDRFLAYVYLGPIEQDVMLNELLVSQGLAKAEPQYRYSEMMKRRFLAAEDSARAERRGIWSLQSAP